MSDKQVIDSGQPKAEGNLLKFVFLAVIVLSIIVAAALFRDSQISGMITENNGNSLTLRTEDGEDIRILYQSIGDMDGLGPLSSSCRFPKDDTRSLNAGTNIRVQGAQRISDGWWSICDSPDASLIIQRLESPSKVK